MNIVVLEGQVNNPGDLSWDALDRFGTVTVYDRTSRDQGYRQESVSRA